MFETLDKAGFGANVTQVASQGDCRVLRLDDKTGEGFMTMYRLFDGVYLMYNDFHLRSCVSQYQNAETMLCIDHCREGRIEHENSLHEHYYMDAGTIRIDKRVHHEGKVELPLSHYHGMTIGFVSGEAEQSLCREMPFLSVDLKALGEKFCPDNKEFLIRENEQLSVIFSQLYHAPKAAKLDYFRVKTVGLIEPLLRVMAYSDDIAQMDTIVTEVRSIIDAPEMVRPEKLTANINGGDIVLDDVHFAYEDKEILHGISLKIKQGEFAALVGPSGSGKTTIARLIASLWDTGSGSISYGGVDIKNIPLEDYNDRIAFVSQDNFLFDMTVRENIRLGRQSATDAEVEQAAKLCGCHDFIMSLENGYDTVVGTGGGHLSGGEKQRISIARAMLKNADVIILDEATAYTDPENEALIQRSVAKLVKGKTLIVIAHRLSTVMNADNIYVVNNGVIEESGTHEKLLEKGGLYSRMWAAHISAKDGDSDA